MQQPIHEEPVLPVFTRIERYRSYAYGLFLHYGLYSIAGRGEWTLHWHKDEWPGTKYGALMERFTAHGFEAGRMAAFARRAGFRYVCLTARHHDGFSLYDTKGLNRFDSVHAPAGRDLVAEFVHACREEGLAVFLYHTTLDWYHPDFTRDFSKYLAYLRDSVRLLCTNYGTIDGFWFDGNWSRKDADWEEDALYGMIRQLQPNAILVNNSSHGQHGLWAHPELDVVTFEQGLPENVSAGHEDRPVAREMCETMNSHWGRASHDYSYKSPADIIEKLCACRHRQGNLLLNIGPLPDGALPDYEQATLSLVGDWLRECGEILYKGEVWPGRCPGRDFLLRQGLQAYYFCHGLPIRHQSHLDGPQPGHGWKDLLGNLPLVKAVRWMDTHEDLDFRQDQTQNTFSVQATKQPYGTQRWIRVAAFEFASL